MKASGAIWKSYFDDQNKPHSEKITGYFHHVKAISRENHPSQKYDREWFTSHREIVTSLFLEYLKNRLERLENAQK